MTLNTKALIAIIAVNFVTISGFGFLFPIFAVYGKAIEANATEIALSIASFSLGNLIANPIWGKASDQFGRKRLLVISLAAGAVITALNVLAVTPWALIFARFIAGLAAGSFSIAFAVAADISTPENRTRVMGTVGAGFSLGFIMGPAIGGFVAGGDPGPEAFTRVCYAGAALMLIGAVITQIFLPETRPEDDSSADTENAPKQVSRWAVLRDPVLGIIILLSLVSSIAMAKMEATFAIFADDVLSLSPFGIGLYFAAMGGIGVIGQAGAAGFLSRKIGERGMLFVSLAFLSLGMFTLATSQERVQAFIGMCTIAIGFSMITPAMSGLTSLSAPPRAQGVSLGLVQSSGSLGRVIGPAFAGIIYDMAGPPAPFYVGSAILLICLIAMGVWMRVVPPLAKPT